MRKSKIYWKNIGFEATMPQNFVYSKKGSTIWKKFKKLRGVMYFNFLSMLSWCYQEIIQEDKFQVNFLVKAHIWISFKNTLSQYEGRVSNGTQQRPCGFFGYWIGIVLAFCTLGEIDPRSDAQYWDNIKCFSKESVLLLDLIEISNSGWKTEIRLEEEYNLESGSIWCHRFGAGINFGVEFHSAPLGSALF